MRLHDWRVKLVFALLLFAPVSCFHPAAEPTPSSLAGRDVFLITVDTLRADTVGAYGRKPSPTPVLDDIARRGVVFTQATTPFPRTTPALASLLSGLTPKRHGSREVGQAMHEDVTLVSQILAGPPYGYRTVAVTGNRVAGRNEGFARGFDVFEVVPGAKPEAEAVTSAALAQLSRLEGSTEPLFLWVHYVDPHFPYAVLEGGDECRRVASVYAEHPTWVFADRDGLSSRALAGCRDAYWQEVSRADSEIGRLLGGLRTMGHPDDQALLIFTSDHGENLGEQGLFYEHGPSLHDAGIRVPLIVAGPGVEPHAEDGPARLEDLAPTMLSLLGVDDKSISQMEGVDLSRRLAAGADDAVGLGVAFAESGSMLHPKYFGAFVAGRAEYNCVHEDRWSLCGAGAEPKVFELFDHESDPSLEHDVSKSHPEVVESLHELRRRWPPESARQRAVRTPRFKLVEIPERSGGWRRVLYDLEADPEETHDVGAEHPEVFEHLGRSLDDYVRDLPAPGTAPRDDKDLEALRALGYVE